MKKPLFNEVERRIIYEDKSLHASRMKMHIYIKKFEKEFIKSFVGRLIKKTNIWLFHLLT